MKSKAELYIIFRKINISFKTYEHKPINNVDDAIRYAKNIPGTHCKNLFLRDTKENLYLVITLDKKRANLKEISRQIKCTRLSFSSSRLLRNSLGIEPGCVSPVALINDIEKKVVVLIDNDLLEKEEVCFHPLVNSETVKIKLQDLFKFIEYCGQKIFIIDN